MKLCYSAFKNFELSILLWHLINMSTQIFQSKTSRFIHKCINSILHMHVFRSYFAVFLLFGGVSRGRRIISDKRGFTVGTTLHQFTTGCTVAVVSFSAHTSLDPQTDECVWSHSLYGGWVLNLIVKLANFTCKSISTRAHDQNHVS